MDEKDNEGDLSFMSSHTMSSPSKSSRMSVSFEDSADDLNTSSKSFMSPLRSTFPSPIKKLSITDDVDNSFENSDSSHWDSDMFRCDVIHKHPFTVAKQIHFEHDID